MVRYVRPGDRLQVRSARGDWLDRRAVSDVLPGDQFPVVSREGEWLAAQAEERAPDAVPWPAEDVRPARRKV